MSHVMAHALIDALQYGAAVHPFFWRHPGLKPIPGTGSGAGAVSGAKTHPRVIPRHIPVSGAIHTPVVHCRIRPACHVVPHIIQLTVPPNHLYFSTIICLTRKVVTGIDTKKLPGIVKDALH
jgi:hypothetical protein